MSYKIEDSEDFQFGRAERHLSGLERVSSQRNNSRSQFTESVSIHTVEKRLISNLLMRVLLCEFLSSVLKF